MIHEDIRNKDFSLAFHSITSRVFAVQQAIMLEKGEGDGSSAAMIHAMEGWYYILDDVMNDIKTISDMIDKEFRA